MNKRILKRHKRQVQRAKEHAKPSEPDVRTPEQVRAARQASRPAGGWRSSPQAKYAAPSVRNRAAPVSGSSVKGED